MTEIAYVITWRYSDGSGSGAVAAFVDMERAEALIRILRDEGASRDYRLDAVPFDSTPKVKR
jgi:hypothetical protein